MNLKKRFSFENYGTNSFMVYELSSEDKVDSLGLGMLSNNKIPGVLPLNISQLDETRFLKYNIKSKISLEHYFSGSVKKQSLIGVFSSIINAVVLAEEYMLEADGFCLETEHIFIDVSSGTAWLAYLPIENRAEINTNFDEFIRAIMFKVQFDPTENGDYVLKIMSFLNGNPNFSFVQFKKVIEEIGQVSKTNINTNFQEMPKPKPVQQNINVVELPGKTPVIDKSTSEAPSSQKVNIVKMETPMERKVVMGFEVPGMTSTKSESVPTTVSEPDRTPEGLIIVPKTRFLGNLFNSSKKKKGKVQVNRVEVEEELNYKKRTVTEVSDNKGYPGVVPMNGTLISVSPNQNPQVATNITKPTGETTVLGATASGETTILGGSTNYSHPYLLRIETGEKIYLDKPIFRIGKEKSFVDYVCASNTAISRTHADIITKDGEYFVRDNNSTNGSFINGERIASNQEQKVKHEDKLMFANEGFEFKIY